MDRRVRGGLAVLAAVLAVVAVVGISAVVRDGSDPAPPAATGGPLEVSGEGVGEHPFGSDASVVRASATSLLGEPDSTTGPTAYVQIPGQEGWFEVADDPISPGWAYPIVSETCWGSLCLVFGGETESALALRGWALASPTGAAVPDVRLAGSGIRLGDSWEALHAAYPETVVGGAEGASLAVHQTPWPGFTDGAAEWRLSGLWDHEHPTQVPDDAVVTRLSAGEGPEPGCC